MEIFLFLWTKKRLRQNYLGRKDREKFIVFWNNRNARRKQSGTLFFGGKIGWTKEAFMIKLN
jgi:hypothetical protein